ncbi:MULTISPECIES: flavin reductase family protein [unclassified Aureimonas]|uniref:flavin reductase family protein n=1 Tax=unclassified Aureimonas TaxID=2615206 RepID=UPI0006FB295C|nr:MULTISPECIES: flavin reductase family protein [unclassified Aureimonas]KQT68967.1 hypothetical protein ASG54_04730 [Aureimonas sp. Leaf460]KQT69196.1 hypothetical protein ASG62_17335 [Aureimonas sp. Leaf427]
MSGDALPRPVLRPGDAETFRQLWRGIGSTVTLIATEHEGERHAMVATAVNSVSMDPPSLLVCVNRSASSHDVLGERGAFSLQILGREAHELATTIAGAPAHARLSHGGWHRLDAPGEAIDGLPWLEEAQARLFCVIDARMAYGTHSVLIARIAGVSGAEAADPLLYCDGSYGRFEALAG